VMPGGDNRGQTSGIKFPQPTPNWAAYLLSNWT